MAKIKEVSVTRTRRYQMERFDERLKYEHVEFSAFASAELDEGDDETEVLQQLESIVEQSIARQVEPLVLHAKQRMQKLREAYPDLIDK